MKKNGNEFRRDRRVRGRCCCVFDRKTGLLLRVMPIRAAAERWTKKHYPDSPGAVAVRACCSASVVRRVFDDQMRVGLTAAREIDDLLWYGCVSSDWNGPKRNPGDGKA